MRPEPVFLDTSYLLALMDRRDQHHRRAVELRKALGRDVSLIVTEAVLIESANAVSAYLRPAAAQLIEECFRQQARAPDRFQVVPVDTALLKRALELFVSRPDKSWGMTDCISFVVMGDFKANHALTADHHFVQAGFRALLLES